MQKNRLRKKRTRSAAFKAKVAREAIKEDKTIGLGLASVLPKLLERRA